MIIDGKPTPCDDSDAWFVEDMRKTSIPGERVSVEERRTNREAIIRAKLTCMTRCPIRKDCMEQALSFTDFDQHFVYGGYMGLERQTIVDGTPLRAPAEAAAPGYQLSRERLDEFLDYHLTFEEAAERWGVTLRQAERLLMYGVWQQRVVQGDSWVMLHDGSVAATPVDAMSKEPPAPVRAA